MGRNDQRGANAAELQRRVWELERAVAQLQTRVSQLEATPQPPPVVVQPTRRWTCSVSAFGKTFARTADTRG